MPEMCQYQVWVDELHLVPGGPMRSTYVSTCHFLRDNLKRRCIGREEHLQAENKGEKNVGHSMWGCCNGMADPGD